MSKTDKEIPVTKAGSKLPVVALFTDMERIFEDMLSGRWIQPFGWNGSPGVARVPNIDVIDRDDELLVRAEVPGYSKDEIQISVADGSLTIKGETKSEEKEERADYYRCEISRGAFSRTIGLPAAVDESRAKASMKDGVLELTLPKSAKTKRQTIAIS